jgi:hypothetical protein
MMDNVFLSVIQPSNAHVGESGLVNDVKLQSVHVHENLVDQMPIVEHWKQSTMNKITSVSAMEHEVMDLIVKKVSWNFP